MHLARFGVRACFCTEPFGTSLAHRHTRVQHAHPLCAASEPRNRSVASGRRPSVLERQQIYSNHRCGSMGFGSTNAPCLRVSYINGYAVTTGRARMVLHRTLLYSPSHIVTEHTPAILAFHHTRIQRTMCTRLYSLSRPPPALGTFAECAREHRTQSAPQDLFNRLAHAQSQSRPLLTRTFHLIPERAKPKTQTTNLLQFGS
jgi:hypothetical protein